MAKIYIWPQKIQIKEKKEKTEKKINKKSRIEWDTF